MSDITNHPGHDHEEIGCLEAIEWLYAWLDGELDDASVRQLEQHVAHCQSCYSRREMERALTERIRQTSGKQASPELRDRLDRLLDEF